MQSTTTTLADLFSDAIAAADDLTHPIRAQSAAHAIPFPTTSSGLIRLILDGPAPTNHPSTLAFIDVRRRDAISILTTANAFLNKAKITAPDTRQSVSALTRSIRRHIRHDIQEARAIYNRADAIYNLHTAVAAAPAPAPDNTR